MNIIMLGIFSLLLCAPPKTKSAQGADIAKVEMASTEFNTSRRMSWSFNQVWTSRDKRTYRKILTESSALKKIDAENEQLKKTSVNTGARSLDTRIACLIHRKDGVIDSLSFSTFYIKYNGRFYGLYRPLIMEIAEHLPNDHREQIVEFLDTRERLLQRQDSLKRELENK